MAWQNKFKAKGWHKIVQNKILHKWHQFKKFLVFDFVIFNFITIQSVTNTRIRPSFVILFEIHYKPNIFQSIS